MRIILCGGGTVGHITPAIAVAEYLRDEDKNTEILFVGREGGEENNATKKCGFALRCIEICGFKRKMSVDNIKTAMTAIKAKHAAKQIIKDFSPDAVLGTGGYVSWPVLRMAQKLRIPTLIHESNAAPGLVTKLLAPKCDRVLLNLDGSDAAFRRKDNIRIVGNPVREEFFALGRSEARRRLGITQNEFLIFSFGGSGGSDRLNQSCIALMMSHSAKTRAIRHIHATGNKYFAELKKKYPELACGKNGCIIKPYIDDMATVMIASDVVISRSGAMTVAELSASGTVAILIPSPNVTNNHQYKNAKLLCDGGAAIMIEEEELSERALLDAVRALENDALLRRRMSEKIKKFCVQNSREIIASEIKSLLT